MASGFDLSRVPVDQLDSMWAEMIQRSENAEETSKFYERQLAEGKPVTLASLQRSQDNIYRLEEEQKPLAHEWEARGGWQRVWSDSYGKLHRSTECGKNLPHQYHQLLPALSGWSDRQIIEHSGTSVCVECFPEAEKNNVYRRELRRQKQESRCPGSTRKVSRDDKDNPVCSVCGEPVELTPAGRARSHQKQK